MYLWTSPKTFFLSKFAFYDDSNHYATLINQRVDIFCMNGYDIPKYFWNGSFYMNKNLLSRLKLKLLHLISKVKQEPFKMRNSDHQKRVQFAFVSHHSSVML